MNGHGKAAAGTPRFIAPRTSPGDARRRRAFNPAGVVVVAFADPRTERIAGGLRRIAQRLRAG